MEMEYREYKLPLLNRKKRQAIIAEKSPEIVNYAENQLALYQHRMNHWQERFQQLGCQLKWRLAWNQDTIGRPDIIPDYEGYVRLDVMQRGDPLRLADGNGELEAVYTLWLVSMVYRTGIGLRPMEPEDVETEIARLFAEVKAGLGDR